MPEKIEASLNWPETGLAGVPADVGLAGGTVAPPESTGNGTSTDATTAAGASLYDPKLAEGMVTLSATVRELATTIAAAGSAPGADSEALRTAGDTLRRLGTAADGISHTLEEINRALDERLRGVRAQLEFGNNMLAEDDPALLAQTEYRGGIPGVNTDPEGLGRYAAGAVTWPPWAPPKKPSMWSRVTRSNIAIPLMLVAVIAIAAVAYKVVEHVKAQNNTPAPVVTQQAISSYGSVKVIAGTTCHAGAATATVQLAAAQEKNGTYLVSVAGTMSNSAGASLSHVTVYWGVTYADGYEATQRSPVNAGADVPGKSTKTFYSLASQTDGSVPPASINVLAIGASPALPACS